MSKLTKGAALTDIHFGARGNSAQHNQDCLDYLDWFCGNVVQYNCDFVVFLGDWFENRNALNVSTLHYSYMGAKKLNDLNIPVYFIIGNHDLYHRHNREVHSTIFMSEFDHFKLITEPTVIPDIHGSALLCPYMFHDEYPDLLKFNKTPIWYGHFEFQNFIVTGTGIRMPSGPNPDHFNKPKFIFSGHFHKRQRGNNIIYIGNTFPTSFGDANDFERGMMIFDHVNQVPEFLNWDNCPKFIKLKLSELLDETVKIYSNSRVKCLLDVPITYEEQIAIKHSFQQDYSLRDFVFEEETLSVSSGNELEEVDQLESTNDMVIRMLQDIDDAKINNDLLLNIYTTI